MINGSPRKPSLWFMIRESAFIPQQYIVPKEYLFPDFLVCIFQFKKFKWKDKIELKKKKKSNQKIILEHLVHKCGHFFQCNTIL